MSETPIEQVRRATRSVVGRLSRGRREASADAAASSVPQVLSGLGLEVHDVVVIGGVGAVRLSNEVAAAAPQARVHLLRTQSLSRGDQDELAGNVSVSVCTTPDERADRLAELPQPQMIIDHAEWGTGGRLACFKTTFLYLAPGGAYLVRTDPVARPTSEQDGADTALAVRQLLGRDGAHEGKLPHRRAELAAATGDLAVQDGELVVRKRLVHRYKLREARADGILRARYGQDWGEVVLTRPQETYRSAATVTLHGAPQEWHGQADPPSRDAQVTVPPLSLRSYPSVRCWSYQRVARDNYWLPDTFRHPLDRYLMHRKLASSNPRHARLPDEAANAKPTRRLTGSYYYFDSEYPGHFGHVITETLGKVWGWHEARAVDPSVRPLFSLEPGMSELPAFEQQMLRAAGVDLNEVTYLAADESVDVETLYAASPGFVMPQYAAPHMGQVWGAVGSLGRPQEDYPRRLFVARRMAPLRSCENTAEVEDFFSSLGFTLVYPADHPLEEQIGMFQHADVIAGFSGSGMFSMAFAPGKTVIVMAGDSFTATNEFLFSSVLGSRLHCFWGDSAVKHPPGKWAWKAYQSNFVFDVERFAPELKEAVEDAG
ncbi:MAG TPA: glycosyltransferase family 61 protein [Segeticoccus sp.]|uniref:glycosyltransferase family 61 protein n=1 Tax=Segeticoccus sp. TaxID=2706531 RepID=UPI002D80B31C|nr:glycosyltransferase family 61 protein [Segeticoccus sp.]HET8601475.1 glycosyltransferase family 61 protein [Segeticoccus sp.]